MAHKKKLVEMDVKHADWLKKSSRDLGKYEKDIIYQVFEYAIKHNALESFKKHTVVSELQKTLEQLSGKAKDIAALQERSERLLKEAEETTDGK